MEEPGVGLWTLMEVHEIPHSEVSFRFGSSLLDRDQRDAFGSNGSKRVSALPPLQQLREYHGASDALLKINRRRRLTGGV